MTDFEIAATPETRCTANRSAEMCYQRISKVKEEGWITGGDPKHAMETNTVLAMAVGVIFGLWREKKMMRCSDAAPASQLAHSRA